MELITKKGYKNTEVGLIPEDWGVVTMDSVCDFVFDGTHGSFDRVREGYRLLSVRNLIGGELVFREDDSRISRKDFEEISAKFLIKENDIQLAIVGATLGKVGLVRKLNEKFVTQRSLATIRTNQKESNFLFLYFFIKSNVYQKFLWEKTGFSAQPGVYLDTLQNSPVPIPPTLTEQKAIATALSDVEALISSLNRTIIKKETIKQGAIQQLLKTRVGWTTKTIKEIAVYRRGSFPQPYGLAKWYDEISGMPFVQVVDVAKNKKLKAETKQKISSEGAKKSVFVKKGSVILTIQGSIGRICITQYDTYVDRTLLIFESFKEEFNTYFFMISIWLKFQIEKEKAPGGIIKTITKEALSSFEISFPKLAEQDKIAEVLEDIEEEINALEIKKAKYQAIKQGMMQELLTGKTRLI